MKNCACRRAGPQRVCAAVCVWGCGAVDVGEPSEGRVGWYGGLGASLVLVGRMAGAATEQLASRRVARFLAVLAEMRWHEVHAPCRICQGTKRVMERQWNQQHQMQWWQRGSSVWEGM